jgi:transcriptional regulator with XRE-family HTH domain/Zn-dependent peptidase ImmA (M78 family)
MLVKDRIAKRRKELGLNQTELAKRAGLHPPAISQYESGARNPSYEALIKLSNALEVNVDYLISGQVTGQELSLDKKSEVIMRIVSSLDPNKKNQVLDYLFFLTGSSSVIYDPIFTDPSEYSAFVRKNYSDESLPIDVFKIASDLRIRVIEDDLKEAEGIVYKGKEKVILLDKKTKWTTRKKFTLAILLGHAFLPWHTQVSYSVRKPGTSTLLTENIQDMEAHKFAHSLLMPLSHLKEDFINTTASLENLKKLAEYKYDVSLFSLSNRLVEAASDRYAIIQSENNKIIKTFPGTRNIKEIGVQLDPTSLAFSFSQKSSKGEEIRSGEVPAHCWLIDSESKVKVHEESIYNSDYGKVLTLLRFQ